MLGVSSGDRRADFKALGVSHETRGEKFRKHLLTWKKFCIKLPVYPVDTRKFMVRI